MKVGAFVVAALALSAGAAFCGNQASAFTPVPVRVTWGDLNSDGYAQVTFVNDSDQIVTAWSLMVTITHPDGKTVVQPATRRDSLGSLAAVRLRPNFPVSSLLMPGKAAVVPVRVGDRTKVSGFSLSVDAVVLEDGTVLGNRASLASFLAAREVDGNAADQWLTKFQAASDTPDAETAAAILQQAIDELPSARMALTLQGIAQRATSQRASEAVLRATIAEGIKTATVHVTECRRHLSRMP